MKSTKWEIRIARDILAMWDKADRERLETYERNAAADRKAGYRPHYCEHGMNMWVDYDCACWSCEMGEPTRLESMQSAIWQAKREVKRFREFYEASITLSNLADNYEIKAKVSEIIDLFMIDHAKRCGQEYRPPMF